MRVHVKRSFGKRSKEMIDGSKDPSFEPSYERRSIDIGKRGPEERCWVPGRDILHRSLIKDFLEKHPVPPVMTPGGVRRRGGTVRDPDI